MPTRPMTATGRVVIAADPARVYAHVSDPRRTREWSPENTGARFDGGDDLAVGDTFTGTNKRGPARWVTRCRVTHAEPGHRFAFRVEQIGVRTPRLRAPISQWDYTLSAVDEGTEVIETWTDLRTRWPDAAARAFDFVAVRGSTFAQFNARNIAVTLRNLKVAVEGA